MILGAICPELEPGSASTKKLWGVQILGTGRPGLVGRFWNKVWLSMYKFTISAVIWAFVMYWLLSEYTNILA